MAPTDVLRILLIRVLGIQDCHVAALNKLDHLRALGSSEISRIVRRRKKRQSLNVVPVSVRDQKSQLHRARPKFFVQCETEQANSAAGIENNDLAISTHFHATGVSTITHCALSRDRN